MAHDSLMVASMARVSDMAPTNLGPATAVRMVRVLVIAVVTVRLPATKVDGDATNDATAHPVETVRPAKEPADIGEETDLLGARDEKVNVAPMREARRRIHPERMHLSRQVHIMENPMAKPKRPFESL
jgi:hypothetical protein